VFIVFVLNIECTEFCYVYCLSGLSVLDGGVTVFTVSVCGVC
jgi:hypothetical protein